MRGRNGPQATRARFEAAGRTRVVGERWRENLDKLTEDGIPFDLVLFTGDLGDWGLQTDYPQAIDFLRNTCSSLNVPLSRLFIVPGNHDIQRTVATDTWRWLRSEIPKAEKAFSLWMAGDNTTALKEDARRDEILARQGPFWNAISLLEREALAPQHSPHGRLGYQQTLHISDLPTPIHIIGLDSSWLAGDEQDSQRLRLTEHQLDLLTTDETGVPLQGIRLALMHHRLEDLADSDLAKKRLAENVDILLHGHQHKTTSEILQGPNHQLLVLAAGCLYEGDEGAHYPNAYQVIDIHLNEEGTATEAAVRFRGWSSQGEFWGDNSLLYPNASQGRLRIRRTDQSWSFVSNHVSPTAQKKSLHLLFAEYRLKISQQLSRWGNEGVSIDNLYIPPRFDRLLRPGHFDEGDKIDIEQIVQFKNPICIVGDGGCGKTTWLRYMHKKLATEIYNVPIFIELRRFAACWNTVQKSPRPIESYLYSSLFSTNDAESVAFSIDDILAPDAKHHHILLVDGWDELGTIGDRFRELLSEFRRKYPHIFIVVTSRPYGSSRPANVEGFDTFYVQPASDNDIQSLAEKFYRHIVHHDASNSNTAAQKFMMALQKQPGAQGLARNLFFLSLMLRLSRDRPLPDRRHQLYDRCVMEALGKTADTRATDSVFSNEHQWRHEDIDDRLATVAKLAYGFHTRIDSIAGTTLLVHSRLDALAMIDAPSKTKRAGFLQWLIESAGLITDYTDGSVQFIHRSLQEHLAAQHLLRLVDAESFNICLEKACSYEWIETLRQFGSLLFEASPARTTKLLTALKDSLAGYWLAGHILASGDGTEHDFTSWQELLPRRLINLDNFTSQNAGREHSCALSWATSRDQRRRAILSRVLSEHIPATQWIQAIWYSSWAKNASIELVDHDLLSRLERPVCNETDTAYARVIYGSLTSWPGSELAMLRLWPSRRSSLGSRLQTAVSLGADVSQLRLLASILASASTSQHTLAPTPRLTEIVVDICHGFRQQYIWVLCWDILRELQWRVGIFSPTFASMFLRTSMNMLFGRSFIGGLPYSPYDEHLPLLVSSQVRDFLGNALFRSYFRDFGMDLVDAFSEVLKIPPEIRATKWWVNFVYLDLISIAGFAGARASIFRLLHQADSHKPSLLEAACEISVHPGRTELSDELLNASQGSLLSPLFLSLARHVGRISSHEDRARLTHAAEHPSDFPSPLSWGLQYYVRGDVLAAEGSIHFDSLCTSADGSPLPLIDELPPEIPLLSNAHAREQFGIDQLFVD